MIKLINEIMEEVVNNVDDKKARLRILTKLEALKKPKKAGK